MDSRLEQARHWLLPFFKSSDFEITVLSDDASFRRYFRVIHGSQHYALMDAPPEKENSQPFLALAQCWKKAGINVPIVYAADLEEGFLLLEDFGDRTFITEAPARAESLYPLALNTLIPIQSAPIPADYALPLFDETMCRFELGIFREWLVEKKLGLSISREIEQAFAEVNNLLVTNALEQPQVVMHRDYHSRNLMLKNDNTLGIIDFQGAVIGPIAYDVASLLRDCYIRWPEARIRQWREHYLDQYHTQQPEPAQRMDSAQFERWFDLIGLQRHIKAAGIFARLSLRDQKDHYLKDIPLTFHYILEVMGRYPECADMHRWLHTEFTDALGPALARDGIELAPPAPQFAGFEPSSAHPERLSEEQQPGNGESPCAQ